MGKDEVLLLFQNLYCPSDIFIFLNNALQVWKGNPLCLAWMCSGVGEPHKQDLFESIVSRRVAEKSEGPDNIFLLFLNG